MSDDMLRADQRLRRLTTIALVVATLVCLLAMFAFQRWINGIGEGQHVAQVVARIRSMIGLALTGSALCFAVLAWHAARIGQRARSSEQWPVPGARVIRDTPVRRGRAATRIGVLLQVAAVVLIVLASAAGTLSWRMFGAGS